MPLLTLNEALDAISSLVVVLRVDLLYILDVFDELLVRLLARLDRKVRDVGLH